MAGKIFISYRRDDSRYQAARIYDAFLRGLPRENIFMDIDTIPLGVNFVKVLEGWVEQCEVLLVLMGEEWANSADPKTGKRRLDNPKDFVRVEVRGALTRDIPVVPVLLDGAELPDETELPDDIKGLLNRNAEFVDFRTFDADVQRLLKKLGVGGSGKQTVSATVVRSFGDQVVKPDARERAEGSETQGDLADNTRQKRTLDKEWRKRWLTPLVAALVILAAAIGALFFLSPELLSGRKVDADTASTKLAGAEQARQAAVAKADDAEKARQAAQSQAGDAEKARQAAEAKTADADKARQAAEAKVAQVWGAAQTAEDARKNAEAKVAEASAALAKSEQARQAAQAQAADAQKARQAAEAKLADAEKARQAADAKAADAEKARQVAEAKAADGDKTRLAAEAKAAQAVAALAAAKDTRQAAANANSTDLFTLRKNFEARGTPIPNSFAYVSSVEGCEKNCAQSTACKIYTYGYKTKWCYLYQSADLVPNESYDSGVRQ
jgi:hypothetical protein